MLATLSNMLEHDNNFEEHVINKLKYNNNMLKYASIMLTTNRQATELRMC